MSEPDAEADIADEVAAAIAVADAIRGHGMLPPLSEEEREQRWLDNVAWHEGQRQRAEEDRLTQERDRVTRAEAARRQAAIAAAQARNKAQLQRRDEIERMTRDRTLANLQLHA